MKQCLCSIEIQSLIPQMMSDREMFDKIVYTPIDDAVRELSDRWKDTTLEQSILSVINHPLPQQYAEGFKVALCRDIYTPNFELSRFISATEAIGWDPVFGTFLEDKFTSNNLEKYHLGKLAFFKARGKNNKIITTHRTIIDFNKSNGKAMKDIKTLWNQPLEEFHRELFLSRHEKYQHHYFFDISSWFKANGKTANKFYKSFLTLFVRNAILFDNFAMKGNESSFTQNIFLPAFMSIWKKLGKKPLIVTLEPTSTEDDIYWRSYPAELLPFVDAKMGKYAANYMKM